TAYANYAVEDCDFLFAVGSRFDDRVCGKPAAFAPKTKYIAHIDIDPAELGKVKEIAWGHAGDAGLALRDLIEYGKDFKADYAPWLAHVNELRANHAMSYKKDGDAIQP